MHRASKYSKLKLMKVNVIKIPPKYNLLDASLFNGFNNVPEQKRFDASDGEG